MYDTIIIGAGMSGLAAGIRLAHFGQRVCILERHTAIGGLNSFYRQRGRTFDVGLHAMTNYTPKGLRTGPLARLLRQLRLAWDEWALAPQLGSAIVFPGITLRFSNDFGLLESEVRRHFPRQVDNFRRLVANLHDYDQFGRWRRGPLGPRGGRRLIDEPLLVEMIFCPILFYGGAREHDIDFDQFSILFRSIFLEGLARPLAGIQRMLKMLVRRFKEHGGELRLRAAVAKIVVRRRAGGKGGAGGRLGARGPQRALLGWLGGDDADVRRRRPDDEPAAGRMSFVESISILDLPPRMLGHEKTIVFYNDSERFHYEKPDDLVDLRSGTVCSPNNFAYAEPLREGVMRISALANYERWAALDAGGLRLAKRSGTTGWRRRRCGSCPTSARSVIETDMFTPRTIQRFTGHAAGAVYGSAHKRRDGTTHLKNLFICGNDQGLVGVVGTIISGISIANRHLLK